MINFAPVFTQPSQAGDIVGVRLQNTGTSAESAGYVSFGEVFLDGAVYATDSLVARINGVNYAVQMDVKSTNADGSVRQALLTLDAPAIPASGTLDLMLAKGTAAAPSPAAPSAAALLASGYNVGVNFTFHNADGSTTTDSASGAAALQAALSAGTVKTWLSGPGVNEYDVVTTVDGGKLKVEFDIRAYADGTTSTDVIFDNSWMFSPGKNDLNYDVAINQGGQQVYAANGVVQYLYSLWHHQVGSAGTISPNVQYDVPYLIAAAGLPNYDSAYGISDAAIQANHAALNPSISSGYGSTGPMGTAEVQPLMPNAGARPDLATQPNWVAQWLLSQNAAAASVMMANADASGSVPWHLTDESTGKPINALTYPHFWDDARNVGPDFSPQPANGFPTYTINGDPWKPDTAHMPDLNYVPYLVTASHYQLELLQSAANFAITSMDPYYDFNLPNGADPINPDGAINLGLASYHHETRAIGWGIREVAEAAYLTPDTDPLKNYFITELNRTLDGLVQYYITDNMNAGYGSIQGFVVGYNEASEHSVPPWQQDFIVTALAEVAAMNIPQASADAVQMLKYMNNFVSGLYTNGQNGYNPFNGAAYYLDLNDPVSGTPYTSWSQLASGNASTYPLNATTFLSSEWATQTQGGYAVIAKAALADEVTYTQSPQAIQAYGFVVSQIASVWTSINQSETAAYQKDPMWSVMPRLPDGVYLPYSQMQIDTSGASTVTLTASGGDSLLAVVGNGTATLTGGNGTCDLLYGGSGPTTLVAGTGNDYMFGGSASNTFVDNIGNNYMQGAGTANVYMFVKSNSGHDTIANFNPTADHLQIAANLNGNGITSAAQLISGATFSNGNTTLHLSSKDDITLVGISDPADLGSSLVVGAISSPVPLPTPANPGDIAVFDTTTQQNIGAFGTAYSGPVRGLQQQYVYSGQDNMNITVSGGNWFLHGGSGDDAIAAHDGYNVLDGGTGSNLLAGGSGINTFFVDDRGPASDIWSTVSNFHAGDDVTVFGVVPNRDDSNIQWFDNQGAAGYTGLTLHATSPNQPTASLTLPGYSVSDLSNGRLTVASGNETDGTPFLHITAN